MQSQWMNMNLELNTGRDFRGSGLLMTTVLHVHEPGIEHALSEVSEYMKVPNDEQQCWTNINPMRTMRVLDVNQPRSHDSSSAVQ